MICPIARQSELHSRCPRRWRRSAGRTCSICSTAGKRARGFADPGSRWRHSSSLQNCAPSCSCSTWRSEREGRKRKRVHAMLLRTQTVSRKHAASGLVLRPDSACSGMSLCMDPRWSRLCRSEETERVLLERLECSGLSAHLKQRVQSALDRTSLRPDDVEAAVRRAIAAEGIS